MNGNNEYFNALMSYSLFTIVTFISLYKCHQSLPQPLKQTEKDCSNSSSTSLRAVRKKPSISIFYGTCTGTARIFAQKLSSEIFDACNIMIEATDLKDFDEEKIQNGGIIFIILSTISDGNAPESAQAFVSWLNDLAFDFRISKDFLSKIKFAVFGLGGQVYGENFCLAVSDYYHQISLLFLN
jgi:sulfite reductase alpha subunit-like flavoprotein